MAVAHSEAGGLGHGWSWLGRQGWGSQRDVGAVLEVSGEQSLLATDSRPNGGNLIAPQGTGLQMHSFSPS